METTLFLCERCGQVLELEDYQLRTITHYARAFELPVVVHCWSCVKTLLSP
jgi:hypothetical protein